MAGRDARRRRILEGGQDRLALITGRKPSLSSECIDPGSSPPFVPPSDHHQDLKSYSLPSDHTSASYDEDDKYFMSSPQDQAPKSTQNDAYFSRREEEPTARKYESTTEPARASASEENNKGEPSAAPKGVATASDTVLRLAQQIPIGHLSSQQVSVAVAETEHDRMLCALVMAISVVLSYAGFPIFGSRLFRWIILFRPLFLVLITNITLIARRLHPENQKNLARGAKDDTSSLLGDGYAWAEEAGRALELCLMLQNVVSALFMDCGVYAAIVVFGLSLFG